MKQLFSQTAYVILFGLLFLIQLSAQQQPAPASRQDEPTSGSLTGRVVNETGQPLVGANVYIRPIGTPSLGRTTITDSEGNFSVNNLDTALYSVTAMAPSYTTVMRDPDAPPTYYRIGDTVRLEVVKGGVITGTVTNHVGEPIIGIRVRAYMVRDIRGQSTRGIVMGYGERQTDDRGIYRIYGLQPGTYLVFAGGSGTQSYSVSPYDTDAATFAPSSTRDNASEVAVRGGEEVTVDIRYRGEPGQTVSGTVKNVGPSGVGITLAAVGMSALPAGNAYQLPDSRGFAFYGVSDGDYDVVATESRQGTPGAPMEMFVSEPRRISVRGADISGLELTTKPFASISGRIMLEASKLPECQGKRRPILNETLVDIKRNLKSPDEGQASYLRLFASPSLPDKEGAFTLRNLRAGQYSFNPRFYARYWYLQSISLPPQAQVTAGEKASAPATKIDAARRWTTLKLGDRVTGLTITLAEGAASIRGQLTTPEDAKAPERPSIYLVPSERDKADDVLRFFVSDPNNEGAFAFNNLPPGRYWIVTNIPSDPELSPEKIRLPNASESRLRLRRAAESAKVELLLKPCQNLVDYKLPLKIQ